MRCAARFALTLILAAGCGSTNNGGGGGSGGTGGGGSGGSGGGGFGGSGGGGSGGGGGGVTMNGGSVTFTMAPFTVPVKGEIYKCQEFANPWGADAEVQAFESHMSPGSHHLLLFYKSGVANGPLVDCSGLEFAATPYGSQRPDDGVTFPDKVAALVPSAQGFRLQVHYLNATPNPINASVSVTMKLATPGTVTDHAGVFFFLNNNINIPPDNMPHSLSKTCTFPTAVNVMLANSHMHKHATDFLGATTTGTTIYATKDWNEPVQTTFAPPMQLAAGTKVTFTCTWVNDTLSPLTFGESAQTNEMCIFNGQFYPIQGTQNILPCF
jgi:hypothetical protein